MKPIWIIDDDRSIRWVFEKALARTDMEFKTFSSIPETLAALETSEPQVVVSDIRMPSGSGLDLLQEIKRRLPDVPVIIMTAYSDLESAVAAFQGGAFEYLAKPFDVDQAIDIIRRAVEESTRQTVLDEAPQETPEIIGQAPAMQEVFRAIGRLSRSHATVLINGESGTGKELVARAMHQNSLRAGQPFMAVNCAALADALLESELFGCEKGAFTGAFAQMKGRLEVAAGGTVFLDEIGEMPLPLQAKLLRVLQERQMERVGGTQPIKLDIRLIAATNRNLEDEVRAGRFRQDLYYRLNVVTLKTPPLRERRVDIPVLAIQFASRFSAQCGRRISGISPEAEAYLLHYHWPGNIRELENAVERAAVLGSSDIIQLEDLPESVREIAQPAEVVLAPGLQDAVDRAKRQAIAQAFQQASGDHAGAARLLGVHPNYLYRLMRNLGMR